MTSVLSAVTTSVADMQAEAKRKLGHALPLEQLFDLHSQIVRNFQNHGFWEELDFQLEEIADCG